MKKIGRYEILEELGRGAMGVVYKASDPTIDRVVAIKVLSLGASSSEGLPDAREIFLREARAAGRLSHPGIVTIHDALEDTETGASYIVMEFIPGRTLEGILLSPPPLELGRALDLARQVAEALDYAHRHQVIHRDLKPANILLTEDDHVKITDFGIAKIVARESASRTVAVMGTPSYMSPEQITGLELDNRTDLFSMGIIFFMMLTGQKPFVGDTAAVMFKIVSEDPVPPGRLNPKLTPGHDYLVLRCLAKDPKRRYSSASEFLEDLKDVREDRSPRSEATIPLSDLRSGEPTVIAGKPLAAAAPVGRVGPGTLRRWRVLAIGMGCGFLVVLAGFALLNLHHRRLATTPAPFSSTTPSIPAPTAPVAEPTAEVKPAAQPAAPAASSTSSAPTREVQLRCRFELEEATLTISSGSHGILTRRLKGEKKGGLLGIKGKHLGSLDLPVKIPTGTKELTVRVATLDGAVDLTKKVTFRPSRGSPRILDVDAHRDRLTVEWRSRSRRRSE